MVKNNKLKDLKKETCETKQLSPRPWDSPGKSSHFLLQCMKVKSESEVSQS